MSKPVSSYLSLPAEPFFVDVLHIYNGNFTGMFEHIIYLTELVSKYAKPLCCALL